MKALFDTIYLLTPRGAQIRLPELELAEDVAEAELRSWTGDPLLSPLLRYWSAA